MEPKELSGWTFEVHEVSANVYKVVGIDSAGRSVERCGLDPETLLEEAKQDAIAMCNA